jgi:hypothetical protein
MPARLIVLPSGSTRQLAPLHPGLLESSATQAWRAMTAGLVTVAQRQATGADVFICLAGDGISTHTGRLEATMLALQAREACWGMPVFLVVSTLMGRTLQFRQDPDGMFGLMRNLSRAGVRDIFRLPYNAAQGAVVDPEELRRLCDTTEQRRRRLSSLSRHPWRCVVRPRCTAVRTDPPAELAQQLDGVDAGANLLIPIDATAPVKRERTFIERVRTAYPDREYLAVSTTGPPTPALVSACTAERIHGPVRFASELELWYGLARLNDRGHATLLVDHADLHHVMPVTPPSFRTPAAPAVLITQSFPADQADFCRDSAREVGLILGAIGSATAYVTDIAVTPARLSTLLASLDNIKAWVHMGHGDPSGHLHAADGTSVPPDRWLACFNGRNITLSLAVFLSCHSTTIARRFATAGADLAIGFDGAVVSDSCRLLAREVLSEWFRLPENTANVLTAFAKGANAVLADDGGTARAFVPRR